MQGQCLCGAVTFEVDLPDDHMGDVRYCYCAECRRANGTAFSANVAVSEDKVRITSGADVIKGYESSPGNTRAFCSQCGSPVFGRKSEQPDQIRIRLGTLDQSAQANPTAHVWVSEKPDWYKITDYIKRTPQGFDG